MDQVDEAQRLDGKIISSKIKEGIKGQVEEIRKSNPSLNLAWQ